MKRLLSPLLLSGLSALLLLVQFHSAFAYPETHAVAMVGSDFTDDRHWVYAPAVPDSSTASKVAGAGAAYANAFNTGKLGASASTASTRTYSFASITDSLYLNLPQAIPSADGMILYLQLHGSMTSNWNGTYPDAYSMLLVNVNDDGVVLAYACLVLGNYPNSGLWAPPLCDGAWPNDFNEPLNAQHYPAIGTQGHNFSFNAPLFLIMKGVTPAAFNGKELTVQIAMWAEGPSSASFLNTLEFDPDDPIALYASSTQSMIPLPPGASYHSSSGMGISQTPVIVPPPATLDVDASISATKYDALTDGLLIIRYLFGLTGPSLTGSALGGTATRTDPAALKTHLDAIRTALDVDGNVTADALTDGLLIIRYLFGLRGDALIAGAVDPLATRKTAADIEAYLQTLMP
jgi:hypothetical protein